ncbi:MAG TPA: hypothetical protein PLX03_11530, partial [Candidatus Hydrogenedentes bacterium]|nr:hypothetical protein [Candidatus Hydrogenedentota bacterium]
DLYPDISAWSQAVRETAPGLIPDNAPYVQVVLLSRDRGPLESLGTLFCTLVVSGLQWPSGSDNAGISVHGVRTVLQVESEENTYFTNHPDGPLWQLADAQPTVSRDSGLILARVNMAGAFIPVVSGIRIDASVPPVLPPNVPVPVTLRGRFPLTAAADPATGMTLEEAQQAYELFFTDENVTESSMIPASFRSVNTPSGPVAVTPLDEEDGNLLFLTSLDLSALLGEAAQRPVCLLVRAKQNAGDSYLLRGLQVRAVATLETEVSGDGSGTVSVVVSQPEFGLENVSELGDSAALSLGAGVYWAGSRVTATARPNEQSALTGWLVNGINRGDGSVNPLTFTLAVGENTLEAQFHPLVTDRFRLSLEPVSGGVVTVTPVQPETGYPAGTQVTLTAVNNPGNRFVGWTGNLGGVNPSQPVITVTMNEDRTVGAVFIPETNYYLFVHQPEMGGEILADPQPSAAGYLPGVAVTLTAVADDLYVFDRWTGDVDDPQANPATVVMDADRDVG